MNTTTLIAEWTMSGARGDVAARFRSTDDIRTLLAREPNTAPAQSTGSLLVKSADGEDWRPLTTDAE